MTIGVVETAVRKEPGFGKDCGERVQVIIEHSELITKLLVREKRKEETS